MRTVEERFWIKVHKTDNCWEWSGSRRGGYGLFWLDGANRSAHRVSYELAGRAIPSGLVLDHLCRNRACVNPAHLEVVDQRTNIIRGVSPSAVNAAATYCLRGHELTDENTYSSGNNRNCVACSRIRGALRNKTTRGPAVDRTNCPQGHEYTEENTYRSATGGRQCRHCNADRARRRTPERTGH